MTDMNVQEAINTLSHFQQTNTRTVASGSFAEAAYNSNSLDEMIAALGQPDADKTDMQTWNLTAAEWREQIEIALRAKLAHLIEWAID